MTDEEYEGATDRAMLMAGSGPGWNARYVAALDKCGLKLIPVPKGEVVPDHLTCYLVAPIPLEGDATSYPYPALIVPSAQ